ncbi:MAG: hypothetical protein AABY22_20590 [Nanoarchaeota archaeon]
MCEHNNDSINKHSCPYEEDIKNNRNPFCHCCSDCKMDCVYAAVSG